MAEVECMSEEEIYREWTKMTKKKVPKGAPLWLMKLGLTYEKAIAAMEEKGTKVSFTMYRRHKMAKELDATGIKAEASGFLTPMYDLESNTKGDVMKKNGSKQKKEAKVTASSILIKLLGAAHVKGDEDIIQEVREETGSGKFDASQLAWYKWKYRQGALKGMDGKPHTISQGETKKEKKVVIKDRRGKKLVAA